MFAVSDRDQHRFEDVALAWEEQDFLERIAELVAGDCSLHETVDWTVVEEAKRYTVAQWGDIRGVTEDAVRSNVNSAREKLLAAEVRESSGESPSVDFRLPIPISIDRAASQITSLPIVPAPVPRPPEDSEQKGRSAEATAR